MMNWVGLTLLLTFISLGSLNAQIQTGELIGSTLININSNLSGGFLSNIVSIQSRLPIQLGADTVFSTVNISAPAGQIAGTTATKNVVANNLTTMGSISLANLTVGTLVSQNTFIANASGASLLDMGDFLTQNITVDGTLFVGNFTVSNLTRVLYSTNVNPYDATIGGSLTVKDFASLGDVVTPNLTVVNQLQSSELTTTQLTGVTLTAASSSAIQNLSSPSVWVGQNANFTTLTTMNDTNVQGTAYFQTTSAQDDVLFLADQFRNLTIRKDSSVGQAVLATTNITGNASFAGDVVDQGAFSSGSFNVVGNSNLVGVVKAFTSVSIANNLNIQKDLQVVPANNNVVVGGSLVAGNASWASDAVVSGLSTLNNAQFANAAVMGNFNVTGNYSVMTDLTVANLDVVTGGIWVPTSAKHWSLLPTMTSDNFTTGTAQVDIMTTANELSFLSSTSNLGASVTIGPNGGSGFFLVNGTSTFDMNVSSINVNVTGALSAAEATFASLQVLNYTNADQFRGVQMTISNLTITGYASISRMEVKTALDGNIKILGGLKTPAWISALQAEILEAAVYNSTTSGTLNSLNISNSDNLWVSGTLTFNYLAANQLTVQNLWTISQSLYVPEFNSKTNLVSHNDTSFNVLQTEFASVSSVSVNQDWVFVGNSHNTMNGALLQTTPGTSMVMNFVTVNQAISAIGLYDTFSVAQSALATERGYSVFQIKKWSTDDFTLRNSIFEILTKGNFTLGDSSQTNTWNASLVAQSLITDFVTIGGNNFAVNGGYVEVDNEALENTGGGVTEPTGYIFVAFDNSAPLLSISRQTTSSNSKIFFKNPQFWAQQITIKETPHNPPFIGNPSAANPFWFSFSDSTQYASSGLAFAQQSVQAEVRGNVTINGRNALYVTGNQGDPALNVLFTACPSGTSGYQLGYIHSTCLDATDNFGEGAPILVYGANGVGNYTAFRSNSIILDTSIGNASVIKNFFTDSTSFSNGFLLDFDTDTTIDVNNLPQVRFEDTRAIFNTGLILGQAGQRQYFNPTLIQYSTSLPNFITMDFTSPFLEVYPLPTASSGVSTFTIYLPPIPTTGRVYTIYGREMTDLTHACISGLQVNPADTTAYLNAQGLSGWLLEHNVKKGYQSLTPAAYLAQCPSHPISPSIFSVTVIVGEVLSTPGWKVISSSISGFRDDSNLIGCTFI